MFEPQADDYRMFFTNIFSFGARKELVEYAYNATRRDLLRRYDVLAPIFRKHGIVLRKDVLLDHSRNLWTGVGLIGGSRRDAVDGELPTADRLATALDVLDARLDVGVKRRARLRRVAVATAAPCSALLPLEGEEHGQDEQPDPEDHVPFRHERDDAADETCTGQQRRAHAGQRVLGGLPGRALEHAQALGHQHRRLHQRIHQVGAPRSPSRACAAG